MAKLTKTNAPEHVLNRDQAEQYLNNRIKTDKSFNNIARHKIEKYDRDWILNDDTVADNVLDSLAGFGKLNQFTSESLDRMSPEYFGQLIDYQHTDIQYIHDEMYTATMAVIDDPINGGIYTTDEMLRSEEYASDNYPKAVKYAFDADTKSLEELKEIFGDDFNPELHEATYMDFGRLEQTRDLQSVSGLSDEDLDDLNNDDSLKL